MVYEAANVSMSVSLPSVDPEPPTFQSEAQNRLQKEWAEKAVIKYAEAQDRKWQRWNESMFERSA
jgi:hypothetical protein